MNFMFFLYFSVIPVESMPNNLIITENDVVVDTFEREQFFLPYLDPLFTDRGKLHSLLNILNEHIYKEPIDAKLDNLDNIVEEETGVSINFEKSSQLIYKFLYEGSPTQIEIPKEKVFPRVDSELLAEIKEKKIGEYVTYFKESNEERSHNIALSTAAINNHVVFPGERFSFNKVVGERTIEKGYRRAPVIVKGELSEDIGGGICQVSSTLFNAVSLKGIQIVERYSHSRSVPYVPPGKDATVSWWGPDFVFINKYNHPILIRATSDSGRMRINIYSAEDISYRIDK